MPDDARIPVTLDVDLGTAAAERTAGVEPAEADDLMARFRAFAARHTLGGLDVKELISEGRR